jgi:hypothetical protein
MARRCDRGTKFLHAECCRLILNHVEGSGLKRHKYPEPSASLPISHCFSLSNTTSYFAFFCCIYLPLIGLALASCTPLVQSVCTAKSYRVLLYKRKPVCKSSLITLIYPESGTHSQSFLQQFSIFEVFRAARISRHGRQSWCHVRRYRSSVSLEGYLPCEPYSSLPTTDACPPVLAVSLWCHHAVTSVDAWLNATVECMGVEGPHSTSPTQPSSSS